MMSKTKVNIEKLKEFALYELPKHWPLRNIILSEKEDELNIDVFLARLPILLRLSRFLE